VFWTSNALVRITEPGHIWSEGQYTVESLTVYELGTDDASSMTLQTLFEQEEASNPVAIAKNPVPEGAYIESPPFPAIRKTS
jgi:hypothetical protein